MAGSNIHNLRLLIPLQHNFSIKVIEILLRMNLISLDWSTSKVVQLHNRVKEVIHDKDHVIHLENPIW